MVIGSILTPLGLILASFATQLWHVYLSQGILFGFGAAFVFSPSITLPSQWFVRNRAFATGIAVSGSGIGGVALSPMTQYLISTVGYRNSLRVMGGMGFGILGIATCLAFSRWRPAPSKNSGIFSIFDRSIISKHYLILLLFGFLAPFGYIGPFFLAPTYASHIGADSSTGASLVAIMSAMNAISRIVLGYMADYSGRFNTIFACTFFAGLFTMLIWQNSSTYGIYSAYTVLYGLTGGGFVSLFPVVTADIVGVQNIQRGLSLCYLATTLGNLLGTPIAGALQSAYGWTAAIQFSGAPSVLAALVILTLRMMRSKGKIFVKI
ncbi:major facilitator superfamily domain-containing protein [Phycomyces blakesleeanus]